MDVSAVVLDSHVKQRHVPWSGCGSGLWQAAHDSQSERAHSFGLNWLVRTSVFKLGKQSRSLVDLFYSERNSRPILNGPRFRLNVFTFVFCSVSDIFFGLHRNFQPLRSGRNQKIVFSDDMSTFISFSQQENVLIMKLMMNSIWRETLEKSACANVFNTAELCLLWPLEVVKRNFKLWMSGLLCKSRLSLCCRRFWFIYVWFENTFFKTCLSLVKQ